LLGRYARVVYHLAVRKVVQDAPLGGGSTLHPIIIRIIIITSTSTSIIIIIIIIIIITSTKV